MKNLLLMMLVFVTQLPVWAQQPPEPGDNAPIPGGTPIDQYQWMLIITLALVTLGVYVFRRKKALS